AAIVVTEADLRDPPPAPPSERRADDLAYVIYTSGSTGQPKGVAVEHQSALNTLDDVCRTWSIGPEDRVFGISSASFDLSVFDVFGALGAGAALVLPAADARPDPARWAAQIARHRVTIWNSVPALMDLLVAHGAPLPSLRLVMLSGDWIPVPLPDRVRALAPRARRLSLGGATEAAIWSV
ncbi:MAG: AMP-binding protein, partial [Myxococcales bacterium]|nr:AMP-binding protein [Myxococcales bacterium]